ncbi:hypothetical protein OO013_18245 [Mangrovivirga sp. M17]|uniref:DUF5673 domain-containing protein n=1 Tax=Mangrovivirga halotolerans TaxID=2993936 RepID=A0ABT3RVP0_9BACT|nr:hypothetical protein [Mangrovivirga halotolerans]MCX2745829.1 hypothetical protein [Mangrovivirga halotolerans]
MGNHNMNQTKFFGLVYIGLIVSIIGLYLAIKYQIISFQLINYIPVILLLLGLFLFYKNWIYDHIKDDYITIRLKKISWQSSLLMLPSIGFYLLMVSKLNFIENQLTQFYGGYLNILMLFIFMIFFISFLPVKAKLIDNELVVDNKKYNVNDINNIELENGYLVIDKLSDSKRISSVKLNSKQIEFIKITLRQTN